MDILHTFPLPNSHSLNLVLRIVLTNNHLGQFVSFSFTCSSLAESVPLACFVICSTVVFPTTYSGKQVWVVNRKRNK